MAAEFNETELILLHHLKEQGFGVKDISLRLHRRTEDVSEELRGMELINCACCHRNTPIEHAISYEFENGTEETVCAACAAVVEFVLDHNT